MTNYVDSFTPTIAPSAWLHNCHFKWHNTTLNCHCHLSSLLKGMLIISEIVLNTIVISSLRPVRYQNLLLCLKQEHQICLKSSTTVFFKSGHLFRTHDWYAEFYMHSKNVLFFLWMFSFLHLPSFSFFLTLVFATPETLKVGFWNLF